MTTVVISFDEKCIATDSRRTRERKGAKDCGFMQYNDDVIKIHELPGNVFMVGAGDSDTIDDFMHCAQDVRTPKTKERATVCFVKINGDHLEVDIYETGDASRWSGYLSWNHEYITRSSGFMAFGSGGSYATGALAHGASAYDAVVAAIHCDQFSGGKVQIKKLISGDNDYIQP